MSYKFRVESGPDVGTVGTSDSLDYVLSYVQDYFSRCLAISSEPDYSLYFELPKVSLYVES